MGRIVWTMSDSLSDLLPDVTSLQRLLVQREAEIARQSAELLARDVLIEKLKLQLANLRRQRFGAKSEALDKIIDQLELALEEAEFAASGKHHDTPSVEPDPKEQPKRKPLPDHLPREEIVLSPGEMCAECGGTLRRIGEDVAETLEYVPGRFKVIRTVRPKLSQNQSYQRAAALEVSSVQLNQTEDWTLTVVRQKSCLKLTRNCAT